MANAKLQPRRVTAAAARRHGDRAQRPTRPAVTASNERKTRVGEAPAAGGHRGTRVSPPGAGPTLGSDKRGMTIDDRRIVGVIITYSWRPEGELFAIREGKNYIGAGSVSSEPDHRDCNIQIRTDPKMSAEHALILCRHGHFDIVDQKSSNGTFLDGELVPLQGTNLGEKAEIRTGATVWTFLRIEPSDTAIPVPPRDDESDEPPRSQRDPKTDPASRVR